MAGGRQTGQGTTFSFWINNYYKLDLQSIETNLDLHGQINREYLQIFTSQAPRIEEFSEAAQLEFYSKPKSTFQYPISTNPPVPTKS